MPAQSNPQKKPLRGFKLGPQEVKASALALLASDTNPANSAERPLHSRIEVVGTAALLQAARHLFGREFRFGHRQSRPQFAVRKQDQQFTRTFLDPAKFSPLFGQDRCVVFAIRVHTPTYPGISCTSIPRSLYKPDCKKNSKKGLVNAAKDILASLVNPEARSKFRARYLALFSQGLQISKPVRINTKRFKTKDLIPY